MGRTRREDEERRNATAAERAERVAIVFDLHTAGVPRAQLAGEAEVPPESISHLIAWLRRHATEVGHVATCLPIGGEWIYGWAHVIDQHIQEQHKRAELEARSLRVTKEMLVQSCVEQPDDLTLERRKADVTARLIVVEQMIAELGRACRALRKDIAA